MKTFKEIWPRNTSILSDYMKRKLMKSLYEAYESKYINTWIKVEMSNEDINASYDFARKKAAAKIGEVVYQIDGAQLVERSVTGILAEYAVQTYLKSIINIDDFVDTRIGVSKAFDVPDIPQLNMGIKAVERGKIPVVPMKGNNSYPQIICIVDKKTEIRPVVYICGIATPNVMDTYQSDELILDPNLRARAVKSGFYGFQYLESIDSLKG